MGNKVNKLNIALAQINSVAGDIEFNKNKIIEKLKEAQKEKCSLVVFPQHTLYGHNDGKMLKKFCFVKNQIREALNQIAALNFDMDILLNYPEIEQDEFKNEFVLISKGEIKKVSRFEINNKIFQIAEKNDIEKDIFYTNADCLICPFSTISRTNQEYFRNKMLSEFAKKQNKICLYVNRVGADDELVYDGLSRMYDANGNLAALANAFCEDLLIVDLDKKNRISKIPDEYNETTNLNAFSLNYENDLERTYNSIILGIRDYFSKNGFRQAVLGLSGGLDSTICAVLLADALGAQNVLGISLPSKITSNESKNDASELAKNLGIKFIEAPIKNYHDVFTSGFENVFEDVSKLWNNRYKTSFTQDNIQARSRAMVIWGVANEFASTLPIATSDKSEAYMGYATVNGDMSGGFAPIGDVCKTKLFALARWMNKSRKVKNAIPQSIILKPPGAELALDLKTGKTLIAEDALMPYEFLDEVIWRIENLHQSIDNMMQNEFLYEKNNILDEETKRAWLEKFFRRMNFAIYKWYIIPPFLIVDSNSINRVEYSQPITSNINYSK